MFKSSFFAAIGAALAIGALPASPVLAQEASGAQAGAAAQVEQQNQAREILAGQAQRNQERTGGRQGRRNRERAPAGPTPEQLVAEAQAMATAGGAPGCQVTEAVFRGTTAAPANERSFEVACASGPGYILIGSTPPRGIDCVGLSATARILAARDPAAPPASQCAIAQNLDVMRVMVQYAQEAGLPCVPNEGHATGQQLAGDAFYEVGCDGVQGYLLRKTAGQWVVTECWALVDTNQNCVFTTKEERIASLQQRVSANADASACQLTDARLMGSNANGTYYEGKCAAGNGFMLGVQNGVVTSAYPCDGNHRVGGGCTLTAVPPREEVTVPANGPPAQQ